MNLNQARVCPRPLVALLTLGLLGTAPVLGMASAAVSPASAQATILDPGAPPAPCTSSDQFQFATGRYRWPLVVENDAGGNPDLARPCYLAETNPYGVDRYGISGGPRQLDAGQSTTMTIEAKAPIQFEPVPRASWRLRFNASPWFPFDVNPFLRSASGLSANPTVGHDDVFLVDPVWDMSGCETAADQYRWMVQSCTIRMVKGPVYNTPAGQPVPWMVFTASPAVRWGSSTYDWPMVLEDPTAHPPTVWWGRQFYMEMPVFLDPSPYAGMAVEQTGPRTFRFDASASLYNGTIDRYQWDFGDGTNGVGRAVTHTYPPGENTYAPELAVFADGEVSRASSTIDLAVHRSLSVSALNISPQRPAPGQEFTATYRVKNTGAVAVNSVALTTGAAPTTSVKKLGTPAPLTATIAPGAVATFTQRFRYVTGAGSVSGQARGIAADNGQAVGSNTRTYGVGDLTGGLTLSLTPTPAGPFELVPDARGEPSPQPFTATVVVTNTSNEQVNNVQVGALARLTTDDPAPVAENRAAGWPNESLGTLAPGATRTLTYHLKAQYQGAASLQTAVSGVTPSNRSLSADATAPVVVNEHNPVALTWSIDKRYDNPGQEAKTIAQVNPTSWGFKAKYTLNGACPADATTVWSVDGAQVAASARGVCSVGFRRADIDPYRLQVQVKRGTQQIGRKVEKIEAHDYLIMSLGDSLSSGEGVQEQNNGWRHRPCHRSSLAGPAKAARKLEDQDTHSAITFVHLACSGAGIRRGLLERYDGVEHNGSEEAQINRARVLAGSRTIDAIVLSIGINDSGFGVAASHCLTNTRCMNVPVTADGTTQPLGDFLAARSTQLRDGYRSLATELTAQGITADQVHLVEYPDALHNASGGWANYNGGVVELAADETQWLYSHFEQPLRASVSAAGHTHGWKLVTGMFNSFRLHGLDDNTPNRWFNTVGESFLRQGDKEGSLHPNDPGHGEYGRIVARHLAADLQIPTAH